MKGILSWFSLIGWIITAFVIGSLVVSCPPFGLLIMVLLSSLNSKQNKTNQKPTSNNVINKPYWSSVTKAKSNYRLMYNGKGHRFEVFV